MAYPSPKVVKHKLITAIRPSSVSIGIPSFSKICSGAAKRIHSELKEGINIYRVIPLQLKQRDGDKLINRLKFKVQRRKLSRMDLAPLLLTPLMSGKSSVKERILEAQKLLEASNTKLSKEEKQHMEAVLYTFACKFLD